MSRPPHPSVLVVQHVPIEGPGLLGDLLTERGIEARFVAPDVPLPMDAALEVDGLVVLGGPMGVYEVDRYPRLRAEMELLARAVAEKKPVLGICLGSQLLAASLGARVYRGSATELGWFDITLQPAAAGDRLFCAAPARFAALHWHGDVFDLPPGATHLASSERTQYQAFSYDGSAWGLLFHLEAGPSQVEAMVHAFPDEVAAAGIEGEALVASTRSFAQTSGAVAREVFGRWIQLLGTVPR